MRAMPARPERPFDVASFTGIGALRADEGAFERFIDAAGFGAEGQESLPLVLSGEGADGVGGGLEVCVEVEALLLVPGVAGENGERFEGHVIGKGRARLRRRAPRRPSAW